MILVIMGPTGVGKTKLSVEIAKHFDGVIINCDATQVYKELDIGSAKVTKDEMDGVPHFLIDIVSPDEDYTVYDYQKDARNLLERYKDRNIIMTGGTGMYACSALMDYRFEKDIDIDLSKYSTEELYQMVLKKDKDTNIDKHNRVRLERYLKRSNNEVVEPKLLYDDVLFIGLTTDRENLYNIINKRVDDMFDKGLVKEVESLYNKYPNSNILKRAIGYKEVIKYLNNEISLDECRKLVKKNSRHYAKRQYTWFNNKMNFKWFVVDYDDFSNTITDVINYIEEDV